AHWLVSHGARVTISDTRTPEELAAAGASAPEGVERTIIGQPLLDPAGFRLVAVSQSILRYNPALARALVDEERDALAGLAGFRGREVALNWQALKSLNLQYGESSYRNETLNHERNNARLALAYAVDPSLKIGYSKTTAKEEDPLKVLFAESVESLSITKRTGNWGFEYGRLDR
ncbi:MAG: hypothetical protein C4320_04160, partial [Armatimonadota bacterium]